MSKHKSDPWQSPLSNAYGFDYINTLEVDNSTVTLIEFNLPSSSMGRIKWFGQSFSNDLLISNVTWKILNNDAPIANYGNITHQLGTITNLSEIFIYISPGSTNIKLTATSTLNLEVTGRLVGWYYPDFIADLL